MLLGYNTNGFAHHRLADAADILAEIGYRSLAVTLEREQLGPPDERGVARAAVLIRECITSLGLRCTIETGSRFLLDPRRKHQPTLISPTAEERAVRARFLKAAVAIAAEVEADSVSLWSGTATDDADENALYARLLESLAELLAEAERRGVRLAFEPEPGMFIDTMARFERLFDRLNHPLFGLTLDVGHIHCLADGSIADHIRCWKDRLWNVHLEDMRRGVHEHLPFGEGEIDFAEVFAALREINYPGPVHVELSRHSHDAVAVAQRSFEFLRHLT